jgi:translation initiation factor 3 subunit C
MEKSARIAILKLDHLYYKHDSLHNKIKAKLNGDSKEVYLLQKDSQTVIEELVTIVNRHGTPRMKLRATLYSVYHQAIHNRYGRARDLLMKTHIGDIIHLQDITN